MKEAIERGLCVSQAVQRRTGHMVGSDPAWRGKGVRSLGSGSAKDGEGGGDMHRPLGEDMDRRALLKRSVSFKSKYY